LAFYLPFLMVLAVAPSCNFPTNYEYKFLIKGSFSYINRQSA